MTSIVLGRVGLLSCILVGLASSRALATSSVLQDSEALKGATQEPSKAQKARMAKKKAAIEENQKEAAAKKGGIPQSTERGGSGPVSHEGELVNARYGGDADPNAKLDVKFGSETHNFGAVIQGQLLEHTFVMEAAGSADLVIRQAKPTCGCTVSQVLIEGEKGEFSPYTMGSPIKPGQKMQITAAMDTKNKSNKAEVRINVYTNDPVGLYQLGLAAQVEPFMTAAPSYLNLGDLSEDSVRQEKITVRTSRGEKVMLSFDESLPRPTPAGVKFDLVPISPTEDGKSNHWEVKVAIGPGLEEGPMGYAMRLVTDMEVAGGAEGDDGHGEDDGHGHGADDGHGHGAVDKDMADKGMKGKDGAKAKPNFYQVSANIGGRVLGVLSVSPQYLSMGLVRPGQPVSRSVRIVSNDASIDLGNVKARIQGTSGETFPWSEHFTAVVRPIEGQTKAMEIELRLDGLPEGSEGSFKGEMILETGAPAKPEMKVTFSGVCRAGVGRSTKAGGN